MVGVRSDAEREPYESSLATLNFTGEPDQCVAFPGGGATRAGLVVAVLPVIPGFLRAATTPGGIVSNPGFLDTLYTYAWFVTFVSSGAVYLLLMRGASQETNVGDRKTEERS